jgi:hypothetical protein
MCSLQREGLAFRRLNFGRAAEEAAECGLVIIKKPVPASSSFHPSVSLSLIQRLASLNCIMLQLLSNQMLEKEDTNDGHK